MQEQHVEIFNLYFWFQHHWEGILASFVLMVCGLVWWVAREPKKDVER
jgi:hypothetical protein